MSWMISYSKRDMNRVTHFEKKLLRVTGVTIIAYRGHCVAFRQLTKEIEAACVCVISTTWSFGEPFSDREKWSGTLNLYTCNYCRCVKMMPIRHYNLRNKLLKKKWSEILFRFFHKRSSFSGRCDPRGFPFMEDLPCHAQCTHESMISGLKDKEKQLHLGGKTIWRQN